MAEHKSDDGQKREFHTGATRDTAEGKLDYEAFLSPLVLHAYAVFMDFNRMQRDGTQRDGDNWQKGIPLDAYMKSGARHFMDWWMWHREYTHENIVWSLCALIFNASGYLHELVKANPDLIYWARCQAEQARAEKASAETLPTIPPQRPH